MTANWQRRIPSDAMVHTVLLPSSNGDALLQWIEAELMEDSPEAAVNPVTISWCHSIKTEATTDKIQNWKLAGCASVVNLGKFVFAIDEVERLGRWSDVEGVGKPRLEHRVATGHMPSAGRCADLNRAAELLSTQVYSLILRASKGELPQRDTPLLIHC